MIATPYTTLRKLALEAVGLTAANATAEQQARMRGFLARRLEVIWQSEEWPDLTHTEKRLFAPVYHDNTAYYNGDFIFYPPTGKYYQLVGSQVAGVEPADSNGDLVPRWWANAATGWEGSKWVSGTTYAAGDVAYYEPNNSFYQCLQATSSAAPTDVSYWGRLHPFHFRVLYQQTEAASTISAAGWGSNQANLTIDDEVDVALGDRVLVASVSPDGYNGLFPVVRAGVPTGVSVTIPSDPGSYSSGGTLQKYHRPLGEVMHVTSADPGLTKNYREFDHFFDTLGLLVPNATASIWVRHRRRVPILDADDYSATATYAVDDRMLFTDGHFYRCTQATTAGESPTTDPGKWEQLALPANFTQYVVNGAASDYYRMDGQHETAGRMEHLANQFLTLETDKLYRQQGQHRPLSVVGY